MDPTALLYFLGPVLALPLGYGAGRIRQGGLRVAALLFLLAMPFLPTLVLLVASVPLTEEAVGWILGLSFIILFIPAVIWLILAPIGFALGRSRARRTAESRFR